MSREKLLPSRTIVVLVLVVLVGALGVRRIWNDDFFWQLATGAHIVEEGIPRTDPFSWTNPEHERIELRWSWCVLVHLVYTRAGPGALVLLKTGLILAAFGLVLASARGWRHPLATAVAASLAILASSQRFFVRPEVLSWVLLAALIWIIQRRRAGPTRWILAVPLVHVAWVNVQGLFLIGPVLLAIWVVSEWLEARLAARGWWEADGGRPARLRTAASLLAVSLVACLANPYGWKAFWLPIVQFGVLHGTSQKDLVREMLSPFDLPAVYFAIQAFYALVAACVVALVLVAVRTWKERKLGCDLFELALAGACFYLAASAVRNLPLFALAVLPFLIRSCGGVRLSALAPRVVQGLRAAFLAVLLGGSLWLLRDAATDRFNVRHGDTNQFGLGLARNKFATGAAGFLKRAGFRGRLFNTPAVGSVLLAEGFPVFIDPRFEIYMERYLPEFEALATRPALLDEFTRRYDVDGLVLEAYMGAFIRFAHQHPQWRAVYADETAVVFLRADTLPGVPALDLARGGERWFVEQRQRLPVVRALEDVAWFGRVSNPQPYLALIGVADALGGRRLLLPLYEDVLRAWPARFRYWPQLARLLSTERGPEAAAGAYARAVDQDPENAKLLTEAARLYTGLGRLDQARAWLARALDEDPNDPDTLALAGIVELRLGRPEEALELLDEALSLRATDPLYHVQRAEALKQLGRLDEAFDTLLAAFRLSPRDAQLAVAVGELALLRGDRIQARKWADEALTLDPTSPLVQDLSRRAQ